MIDTSHMYIEISFDVPLFFVIVFIMSCTIFSLNQFLFQARVQFVTQNSFTIVLNSIGFILHCVLAHWYKRRVRDQDYPVHRVVEEVYNRYLSHTRSTFCHLYLVSGFF